MFRSMTEAFVWGLVVILILIHSGLVFWTIRRDVPEGVGVAYPVRRVAEEDVWFFADRTFVDVNRVRQTEQQIFDEIMRMIDVAQEYILVDMFLFNSWQGNSAETTRALAEELTEALVSKKRENPDINITFVSDQINTVYGGATSSHLSKLRSAGVTTVMTDLTELRDSNPIYSVLWRVFISRVGNTSRPGVFPHPFQDGEEGVTLRSWLSLINFKANHRKLIVADGITLVTSANPHDGSSAHGNVALQVRDQLWEDVVASEQAVGSFSGSNIEGYSRLARPEGDVEAQLLTEGAIKEKLIGLLGQASAGDVVDVAMFYLSDRGVISAIEQAADRGVQLNLILDANKDAFGIKKIGVPNRPVAWELDKKDSVNIRWCDTHGEQCHSKMVLLQIGNRRHILIGSANLTRRNIGNYNLESNILVSADREIEAFRRAKNYFTEIWMNKGDRRYTVNYEDYKDGAFGNFWKVPLYWVQEITGLSSF